MMLRSLLVTAWSMFGMALTTVMVVTGVWAIAPMIGAAFLIALLRAIGEDE